MADNSLSDALAQSSGGSNPLSDALAAGVTTAKAVDRKATHTSGSLQKWLDDKIGKPVKYAHDHPMDAFLNIAGTGQRAVLGTANDLLQGYPITAALEGGARGVMQPKRGAALMNEFKQRTGIQGLESGPLAGSDLPHKLARGALDFGVDVGTDPAAMAPVDRIATGGLKLARAVAPGAMRGIESTAGNALKKISSHDLVQAFNPDAGLQGLTQHGRAVFESVEHLASDLRKEIVDRGASLVKKHAKEIREGRLPAEVRALFKNEKNVPEVTRGTNPREIISAISRDATQEVQQFRNRELRNAGLLSDANKQKTLAAAAAKGAPKPKGSRTKLTPELLNDFEMRLRKITPQLKKLQDEAKKPKPGNPKIFEDPGTAHEVQARLGKIVNPRHGNDAEWETKWKKLARGAMNMGNKAFLTIPTPHMFNLGNLAYNKYGVGTLAKGVGNAARVATGTVGKDSKLAGKIAELRKTGGHSEYGNLYDELGLTGGKTKVGQAIAGGLNKGIVPLERLANWAQNKTLNPLETGLRAAALDAEAKAGRTGVDAARSIHQTFGTNRASPVERMTGDFLGAPFAKFHLGATVGSGFDTLAKRPGRIVNVNKAQRDFNNQVNPGSSAKLTMGVPGVNFARSLVDPEGYYATVLGPIYQAGGDFSMISQTKKGKMAEALSGLLGRYVPVSQLVPAIHELLSGQKGRAGESGLQDLGTMFTGGYYQKPKP